MIIELNDIHLATMPEPESRVFTDIEVLIDMDILSNNGEKLGTEALAKRWSWDGPSVTGAMWHYILILKTRKKSQECGDGKITEDEGA